jgi:hypothetical protein
VNLARETLHCFERLGAGRVCLQITPGQQTAFTLFPYRRDVFSSRHPCLYTSFRNGSEAGSDPPGVFSGSKYYSDLRHSLMYSWLGEQMLGL